MVFSSFWYRVWFRAACFFFVRVLLSIFISLFCVVLVSFV